jgi:hypothetical protein
VLNLTRLEFFGADAIKLQMESESASVPTLSSTLPVEEPQEPIARERANLKKVTELYRTTAGGMVHI